MKTEQSSLPINQIKEEKKKLAKAIEELLQDFYKKVGPCGIENFFVTNWMDGAAPDKNTTNRATVNFEIDIFKTND